MAESEAPKRRNKRAYQPRTNAVCVTVYHPQGADIPVEVTQACIDAIQAVVNQHSLLVGVATT